MARSAKIVGTIDLTPSWRSLVPIFVAAIEDGTPTGRAMAIEEIYRLADFADKTNSENKLPIGVAVD
jgi:hypothetical protein